jgi:hypothetical protein
MQTIFAPSLALSHARDLHRRYDNLSSTSPPLEDGQCILGSAGVGWSRLKRNSGVNSPLLGRAEVLGKEFEVWGGFRDRPHRRRTRTHVYLAGRNQGARESSTTQRVHTGRRRGKSSRASTSPHPSWTGAMKTRPSCRRTAVSSVSDGTPQSRASRAHLEALRSTEKLLSED